MYFTKFPASIFASISAIAACVCFFAYLLIPQQSVEGSISASMVRVVGDAYLVADVHVSPGLLRVVPNGARLFGVASVRIGNVDMQSRPGSIKQFRDTLGVVLLRAQDNSVQRIFIFPPDIQQLVPQEVFFEFVTVANPALVTLALVFLTISGLAFAYMRGRAAVGFWIAVGLSALIYTTVHVINLGQVGPQTGDGRQNLSLSLNLAESGTFFDSSPDAPSGPYMRREPFYAFASTVFLLPKAVDGEMVSCADRVEFELGMEAKCNSLFGYIIKAHLIFYAGVIFLVAVLAWLITPSPILAFTALHLSGLSLALQFAALRPLTEVHAAFFMVLGPILCLMCYRQSKLVWFFLAGLLFGLLAITKIVFAPVVIPLLVLMTFALARSQKFLATMISLAVLTVGFVIPVGGWMTRNLIVAEKFALFENRTIGTLSVRNEMNKMTSEEFRAGFFYYTPHLQIKMQEIGIDEKNYERFDTRNPEGFRRTAQTSYRNEVESIKRDLGILPPSEGGRRSTYKEDGTAQQIVSVQAINKMSEDLWKHTKVSLLLAYRGIFVERGLGFATSIDGELRYQGLQNVTLRFNPLQRSATNIVGFAALFVAPLFALLWCRHLFWSVCIAVYPALYSHAVYSVISHFNIRYAVPELPLRYLALSISVYLVIYGLVIGFGRFRAGKLL